MFDHLGIGQVNRSIKVYEGAAGKAVNVAKALHAIGQETLVLGFAGGLRGDLLRDALTTLGVPFQMVPTKSPTRECLTVVDVENQAHTELVEETGPVTADEAQGFANLVGIHLPAADCVVMSGTICPGMPDDFYADCLRKVAGMAKLTILDAKGGPLQAALVAKPGVVKPNVAELEQTVGRALETENEVICAMQTLREMGAQRVVVTQGERDVLAMDEQGTCWRITPHRVTPKNPIGSGDSFTAGLADALLRGEHLSAACAWGAACGSANALTWLPAEFSLEEAQKLLTTTRMERLLL